MKMTKILNKLFLLVAAFAFIGNAYPQTCPSGLVGYWKMDETSGTNLTEVTAGLNATRNSSTGLVSGRVDNSQRFTYTVNGDNNAYTYSEYATVPNNAVFNFSASSSFTISYWLKLRDCNYGFQDHIAVSKGDYRSGTAYADGMFASGLNGSCKINFLLRDNTGYKIDLEGDASFSTETWHHVACVRDKSTNKNILYVDGAVTDEAIYNYTGSFSTSLDLQFGNLINYGSHNYILRGDLDEVAIFNKALSLTEINQIRTDAASNKGICSATPTAPAITSTPVTTGTVDVAYSYDVNATGSATITYSLVTFPAGMTINSTSGIISWTPSASGDYNVTVKAANGTAPDATQSFTISVIGFNPQITSTPVTSATVDVAYSYDVNATGTQTGMTYSLVTFPVGMSINSTSGIISWTPTSSGSVPVKVRAANGIEPADTQSFTITVVGFNPDITSTPLTTAIVGIAYSYDVNASGTQTGMTYSLSVFPVGMSINSTSGLISWTPATPGDVSVRVKADNGIAPADSQSFTISVANNNPDINSTPVLTGQAGVPYSYTVHANGLQTGMTYSLATSPAGMTINASSGLISWTPAAAGDFDVKVKADNGIAPIDSQNFTIAVANNNPDITSTPVTEGYVGVLYNYTVHAEGLQTGMTYSLVSPPAGMTINASSGLISWTPASAGNFNIKARADNGLAPADTQSFTINVIEESLCPDAIISLHKLDETTGSVYADYYGEHNATATISPIATTGIIGGAQTFNATTKLNIPDNGSEFDWVANNSFSIECWMKTTTTAGMACVARNRTDYANAASWLIGTNSTGYSTFELRSNGDANAILTGISRVDDGEWHHIIAVRDASVNYNRLYIDGVLEASVSKTYTHTFKADNPLVATIGYMTPYGGESELHFIGSIDEVTIFNRAVTTSEAAEFYNGGAPTGHCKGSNNPPYFSSTPVASVNEDAAYSYTATVNDIDVSDVLSISILTKPAWLNFGYTAGQKSATLTGTPTNSYVGDNDIVLRVSDGDLTRDQIFKLNVINVNDAPVKTSTPVTSVNEDAAYSYTLTVTDVDAEDLISMTASVKPSWLTFTHASGAKTATLTGTPVNENVGANPVSISISDGTVTIYEAYTITVNNINDAPQITGQSALYVDEDQSLSINKSDLTIVDVDNSDSDISITVQAGTNYTFSGNTITPAANFNGQLSVNVIARDLALSSAVYPLVVTVNSVNDSPVITTTPATSIEEGNAYSYTLTVTDLDVSDIITMAATTLPSWMIFSWTAGSKTATISGVPSNVNIGSNPVDISISDGHITVHETYTLTVLAYNDAPVITGQVALNVNEDNSITILKSHLTIVDPDNSQSDLTIDVQSGTNYTFSGNTVTPAANFNGLLSVNVVAYDLTESSAVYHVIITVNPVNDKPVITSTAPLLANVDILYVYVLKATDVDNTTLTKSVISKPDWLTFSSVTGALTGIPALSDLGQHLVILQVTDGIEVENQIFTIVVNEYSGIAVAKTNEFALYPVPVRNELNIKFNNLSEETVVNIISATGSIVETIVISAGSELTTIPMETMKAGFYICHIKNSTINATSRFMIVR
jgi:large repetitive protein